MSTALFLLSILFVTSYATGIECPRDGVEYFPDRANVGQFIGCINGTQNNYNCPDGLLFNPDGQFCYDPNVVKQYSDPKSEFGKCGCTEDCNTNCPGDCNSNCPGNCDTNCPGDCNPVNPPPCHGCGHPVGTCPFCNEMCKIHFLTDLDDCSVFYMCNWGRPIWNRCPAGLHFNTKLDVCDYPWRAGCDPTIQQPCQ